MLKCSKIYDYFRKHVERPRTVADCKVIYENKKQKEISRTVSPCNLCQALGGQEAVHGSDDFQGHKPRDHSEMHKYQMRLLGKDLPNEISLEKSSTSSVSNVKTALSRKQPRSAIEIGQRKSKQKTQRFFTFEKRLLKSDPVSIHCRLLLSNVSDKAYCTLCDKQVRHVREKYVRADTILKHAYKHFDKRLFGCRQCNYWSKTRDTIKSHLLQRHNLREIDYIDLSVNFKKEIMETITRCFGHHQTEQGRRPIQNGTDQLGEKEDKQAVDHQLRVISNRFGRTALKNVGTSNSIDCQLCSKSVPCKGHFSTVGRRLVDHVLAVHLKKSVYRCLRCSLYLKSYFGLYSHMNIKHKTGKAQGDYEDRSGDYKDKIIVMLERCFGD